MRASTFLDNQIKKFKEKGKGKMHRLIDNKSGQLVIISALIIAVLTLGTIIAVYEININNQSIVYRPVNEFLLGTTSDMNRALTVSLSHYSSELMQNKPTEVANATGQQFMQNWQQSLFTSYQNYGFELNQPIKTYYECMWSNNLHGYSSALTTYDLNLKSYGFIGWAGATYKHVQLMLISWSQQSGQTSLTFQLTESVLNQPQTIPIADFPSNPNANSFRAWSIDSSDNSAFINTLNEVRYQGNGYYTAIFDQAIDLNSLGIELAIQTPHDKIWVVALSQLEKYLIPHSQTQHLPPAILLKQHRLPTLLLHPQQLLLLRLLLLLLPPLLPHQRLLLLLPRPPHPRLLLSMVRYSTLMPVAHKMQI